MCFKAAPAPFGIPFWIFLVFVRVFAIPTDWASRFWGWASWFWVWASRFLAQLGPGPRKTRGFQPSGAPELVKYDQNAQDEPPEVHSGHIWRQAFPNAQNEPPETHSGHIWHQAAKMLEMSPLRPILAISGARPPKMPKMSSLRPILAISGARPPKCSK